MSEILGNIHSIETLGAVDGPGIRFVVFLQGCPMRCLYCHNPDTWPLNENKRLSVDEILQQYDGVKEFLNKGGLTVTGGEALVQIDFVTALFKAAKAKGIHTALDTSGVLFRRNNTKKMDILAQYTDLVLLDIKHIDNDEHLKLTSQPNTNILDFARYLSEKSVAAWIRHVVVPTITDKPVYLEKLGRFLASLNNVKMLEILPYHVMAIPKYQSLGIEYPLQDIPALTQEEAIKAKQIVLEAYKKEKRALIEASK